MHRAWDDCRLQVAAAFALVLTLQGSLGFKLAQLDGLKNNLLTSTAMLGILVECRLETGERRVTRESSSLRGSFLDDSIVTSLIRASHSLQASSSQRPSPSSSSASPPSSASSTGTAACHVT